MDKFFYTSEQIRQAEQAWAKDNQTTTWPLMEKAGSAAWQWLKKQWPEPAHITVFCGSGNNGGDGYYVAALARAEEFPVTVIAVGIPKPGTDAEKARAHFLGQGGEVLAWDESIKPEGIIVDALLGTGIQGEVRGPCIEAIQMINQSGLPVLSLDVPSGLNVDTGEYKSYPVKADLTLTFIGFKPGLLTGIGGDFLGEVHLASLGVDSQLQTLRAATAPLAGYGRWLHQLDPKPAKRSLTAHKGNFGHVLVAGGNQGMGGAAIMAGEAAARTGAGWVSLCCHPDNVSAALVRQPEIMVRPWLPEFDLPERVTALVLGPGLGLNSWARERCTRVLEQAISAQMWVVMDADGLNLLAEAPQQYDRWVLTPHPGEAARLLGWDIATVNGNRIAAAQALVTKFGGTVILKGWGTVVANQQALAINGSGNPGMARAGMGDVLAGVIGAGLAKLSLSKNDDEIATSVFETACNSVWLHGKAGDLASIKLGVEGLLATDLIEQIPYTLM